MALPLDVARCCNTKCQRWTDIPYGLLWFTLFEPDPKTGKCEDHISNTTEQ